MPSNQVTWSSDSDESFLNDSFTFGIFHAEEASAKVAHLEELLMIAWKRLLNFEIRRLLKCH